MNDRTPDESEPWSGSMGLDYQKGILGTHRVIAIKPYKDANPCTLTSAGNEMSNRLEDDDLIRIPLPHGRYAVYRKHIEKQPDGSVEAWAERLPDEGAKEKSED